MKNEGGSLRDVSDRVNAALGIGGKSENGAAPMFGSVTANRDVIILVQPVKLQELFAARRD